MRERGFDIVRRGWFIAVAVLAGVLALPAAAAADFTWSGAAAAPNWSAGTNWVGDAAPSGSAGTLSFQALNPGACTTCYQSSNDVSGVTASAISIDDSVPYQITGNGLTLGAGGITAAPTAAGTFSANIALPITLGASQTWSITGASGQQLSVGSVTGSAYTLTVNFSSSGILGVTDVEAGAVTLTGSGVADVSGSLNGTDGNPVGLSGPATLGALSGASTIGPLTSTGGNIQVGAGHPNDGTLAVNGAVALDGTSNLSMFIDQAGTIPSTDYSRLTASGTVNLGGASLFLHGPASGCPALKVGDVDTLVSTTGSLTGTFANAAEDSTQTLTCTGGTGTAPTVEINYVGNTVTATVLTSASGETTTALGAGPSPAVTNQPVTLTATVASGSVVAAVRPSSTSPAGGTVAFYDNGIAISACTSQPVGGSNTATCQTSFAAASSPHSLTAVFTPASASGLQSSTSSVVPLTVNKDSTTTTLAVSSATPTVGAGVSYVATVTPADSGPAQPSGSVQFLDDGTPIPDCASQEAVIAGQAICTLSYPSPGSHSITASYGGDSSFTGSPSSAQTVTVEPAPPQYGGTLPSISGNTTQGQTLTETHGSWTNSPTGYNYQWQVCDSAGNNCTAITGATSQTYTLTASDVGHTIRVEEAAFNAGGPSPVAASSAPTGVVQGISAPPTAPVNTSPPVITGVTVVGRTLSGTTGLWSGGPGGFTYQWQRCSSTGCANVAGATAGTYNLSTSDLGMKIRVVVVAVNSVGMGVGVSSEVGPVIGPEQIKAALAKEIAPKGKQATIGAILKAGGYKLSFTALESGRVVIGWYLVPAGAHLAKASPVLVASGQATFTSAGTKAIKIKLTKAGKKLLAHAKELKLTAKETWSVSGQKQIVVRKTFTLKR